MLTNVKLLLGITDDSRDALLKYLVNQTQRRLLILLGGVNTMPVELEYIVDEVTVRRFNRIGSEGYASHSVEGESMTLSDDDFEPFMDDIAAWASAQKEPVTKRGRVRFV